MRKIVFYNKTVNFNSPVLDGVKRAAAFVGKKLSRLISNEGRFQNNQKPAVSAPQKPSADVKPNVAHIIRRNTSAGNKNGWEKFYADAQKSAVSAPQKPSADASTDTDTIWANLYEDASTDTNTVWNHLYDDAQKPAVSVPQKSSDSVPNLNNPGRKKKANIDQWNLLWKSGYRLQKGNYSRRPFNYSRVFLI